MLCKFTGGRGVFRADSSNNAGNKIEVHTLNWIVTDDEGYTVVLKSRTTRLHMITMLMMMRGEGFVLSMSAGIKR